MLDTNVCIDIMRGREDLLLEKLQSHHPDDVCISTVTLSELEYGAYRSSNPDKNRKLIADFIVPINIFSYDEKVSSVYGAIRAELECRGTPIGPLDTMIASHALSLNITLVTNNEREFRRVPNLLVENWLI